ncbi:putative wall-associated receptor kinase-like protein 16 [Cinnamomum micranthum f. kanehirae]|uniref:Putative wall-associated receptor kinase-like protein 16 n=1 Tax=Cinnamomum micranthum f. kanehirae TaxID=337451 RepID=A0A3S3N0W5_9MAGN|nr:putative wall-associated receptor kinase-like protein 16 [Cinnamomum micranthum f. kanehirae]
MVLYILVQLLWFVSSAVTSSSKPICQTKCGEIDIPYPFGIGEPHCFKNDAFKLTCHNSSTPPTLRPYWREHEIQNISSLLQGEMTVSTHVSYDCYDGAGNLSSSFSDWIKLPEDGPYTYSSTRNQFTAIGCDTVGYVSVYKESFLWRGACASTCLNETGAINGSCDGMGCCKFEIPKAVKTFSAAMNIIFNNETSVSDSNHCSYSFLGDPRQFNFSQSNFTTAFAPTVLDWVVGNEKCKDVEGKEGYACHNYSSCYDSWDGPGYRCLCRNGYKGNPYSNGTDGCIDINECDDENHCNGICRNTRGSYKCITYGILVSIGIGVAILLLIMGGGWTYWASKKRKRIKLKEKFFQQNGGFLLQQKISTRGVETFRIFTLEELERATNNYDTSNIVGEGGFGVVYKGVLSNNRTVAIKRSKIIDASQTEQFVNELAILSQINHRNVVKLLGCCLEDQVPILVYEFIPNGTLYDHIHEAGNVTSISLEDRLRIAVETAEALAYLHSATSMPVLHRDIKSANILLDDNFTAKVSDFGLSRLVPIDHTQISTLVMGTLGYLDPEYFQTGYLTSKSDVYSFGVVLVELLTGEKPVFSNRSQEDRSLVMYFLNAMKEDRLFQVLEEKIRSAGPKEQLMAISQLAKRCLKFKGEDRPKMKEVVEELQRLRRFQEPLLFHEDEETQSLLHGTSQGYTGEASGQYNSEKQMDLALEIGR